MEYRRVVFAVALIVAAFGGAPQASAATKLIACGTINQPGSYILGKNLSSAGNCLVITADNVTIDLDGQTIQGNGTGIGIGTTDNGNIAVSGGSIAGFHTAVSLFGTNVGSAVTDMRISENDDGILCEYACVLTGNVLSINGVAISTSSGGVISGNTIYGNTPGPSHGIAAADGALISGNNIYNVDGDGIVAGYNSTVTGNNVVSADVGIAVLFDSTVSNNRVSSTDVGISADQNSTVQGNTASALIGIRVTCKGNVFDNITTTFVLDETVGACQQSNNVATAGP